MCALYVWTRGDDGPARVGFAAGRRMGSAVVRNRARRRLREAVRRLDGALPDGIDTVWIGRGPAAQAPWPEVEAAVRELWTSAFGADGQARPVSGSSPR
jgi:ribonuclease P protein component